MKRLLPVVAAVTIAATVAAGAIADYTASTACSQVTAERWYRGNSHTHSFWSDGDAAPETVVEWYRSRGYDWLVLTDHDILPRGERWYRVSEDRALTPERLAELRTRFGEAWVETREVDGQLQMRLKTIDELRGRFEEPGRFLLIEGEEISDLYLTKPLHVNVLNPAEFIPVQRGGSVLETFEHDLAAVNDQAAATGRNMLAHINHPNWYYVLTPEELAVVQGTHLFEVYNGSTGCNNYGDDNHPGMDEVWDVANTLRLTRHGLGPLYGLATDDTHNYFSDAPEVSAPGRGWIMVRAAALETGAILDAIRAGEFYASTGVELLDVRRDDRRYEVTIAADEGVTYITSFIGTRLSDGEPGEPGIVLLETTDNPAVYRYAGDELYVRAKVISSRMQDHPTAGEEAPEYAWTQPYVLRR